MKTMLAIGIFAAAALTANLSAQQRQKPGIKKEKTATPAKIPAKTPTKTPPAAAKVPAKKSGASTKIPLKNTAKEATTARAVRNFLTWYRQNINEKNPAKLSAKLKSSGMLSPKFSIAPGAVPDGYDRVLQIEDAATLLQNLAETEIIPVTDLDGKALVKVIFPDAQDLDVYLVKSGQKWLIEDIKGK